MASPTGLKDLEIISKVENSRRGGHTSEVQRTNDKTLSLESSNIVHPLLENSPEESENNTFDNLQSSGEEIQGVKVEQINSVSEIETPGPHREMEVAIEEENEEENLHRQSSFDPSNLDDHMVPTGTADVRNKDTGANDTLYLAYWTDGLQVDQNGHGDSRPPSPDERLVWHSSSTSGDSQKPNQTECLGLDKDNSGPVSEHDQPTIAIKMLPNLNAELLSPGRPIDRHVTPKDSPIVDTNDQEFSVNRDETSEPASIEIALQVVQGEDREISPIGAKSDQYSSPNESPSAHEEEMATIFFLNLGGIN